MVASMAALDCSAQASAVPDAGDMPTRPWTAGVKGVLEAGGASPACTAPEGLPGDAAWLVGTPGVGSPAGVDDPDRLAKILSRDSLRDTLAACKLMDPLLDLPAAFRCGLHADPSSWPCQEYEKTGCLG